VCPLSNYNAARYSWIVIQGFSDKQAQRLWKKRSAPKFGATQKVALRKLSILDAAHTIQDLRSPPANRLEKLSGDRQGQHSIRINDQWRVCFVWTDAGPTDVEITDYR
jgi:proteic killer suppression protein